MANTPHVPIDRHGRRGHVHSEATGVHRPLSRRLAIAGAALAGVGAFAAGRGLAPANRPSLAVAETPVLLDDDLHVSTSGWKTDFSKHSVPLSEISSGGPPRDGIPPIDQPRYV